MCAMLSAASLGCVQSLSYMYAFMEITDAVIPMPLIIAATYVRMCVCRSLENPLPRVKEALQFRGPLQG